jgi:hypothetical protein
MVERKSACSTAAQFGSLGCTVFGGRLAPILGSLSSPKGSTIGVVGFAQPGLQSALPNSRALMKHPG